VDSVVSHRFRDVITSASQLRNVVGPENRWFTSRISDKLDKQCQRFIARSPFLVIGSTNPGGHVDMSPRGDRPGFVHVLDASTLAIPDRRGNRRVDTFHNVLQSPGVGLIFLVPGERETLRVGGTALIVRDRAICSALAAENRVPDLALIVTVERAFFHCGACMKRSKLWEGVGTNQVANGADPDLALRG